MTHQEADIINLMMTVDNAAGNQEALEWLLGFNVLDLMKVFQRAAAGAGDDARILLAASALIMKMLGEECMKKRLTLS